MKFLSLLAVLLLEQARPLRGGNPARLLFEDCARRLERHLNGGESRHGVLAWLLAVTTVVILVEVIALALAHYIEPAAWLWNVAVLYVTMGLRQFSHPFTEITRALQEARLDAARAELGRWRGEPAAAYAANEVARLAIEQALLATHRHVFGTAAWFVVAGAAGAILYQSAAALADWWGARAEPEFGAFGQFAKQAFAWLDWLPARLTAASFAIVGDFEDAAYCWRTQAQSWPGDAQGIILATGAGALGVRLGGALSEGSAARMRPAFGVGDEADVDYMLSATGLVWRALALWMALILVVSVANALG